VFELIKSVSYPNSKAAHLVETSKRLVADFQGEVPSTMEELTSLPGVGRKTANVVMAVLWKKPAFAVDTHIFRVARRLGLASEKCTTPLAVETELTKLFPPELIPDAHHWLLLHGRYVCKSRTPLCEKCELKSVCSFVKG
jgi:endonuclease-3